MNVLPNSFFSSAFQPSPESLAIYHLDNSLVDAANRSPAVKLSGKAAFDNSNLSWMKDRQGAALRVKDLSDKAVAKISLPHPQQLSEITLQAMIFLNAFKAYNRTNVRILSLSEDWNSSLELMEDMYQGVMIKGGSELSIGKPVLTNALTVGTWHHLSIRLTQQGYEVQVNGKTVGSKESGEITNWGRKAARLEIGGFDGYIDEVAVICKTGGDRAATEPAADVP